MKDRIFDFFRDLFWSILSWAFGACFAFLGVYLTLHTTPEKWKNTLLYTVIGLIIAWGLCEIFRGLENTSKSRLQQDISAKKSEVDYLQTKLEIEKKRNVDEGAFAYEGLIELELKIMMHHLWKPKCGGTNCRISLYKHYPDFPNIGEAFVPMGRYSENPQYSKKGRPIYSASEGCIGQAWQHNIAEQEAEASPGTKRYIDEQAKKSGISKSDIEQMKMQSRSYVGIAINSAEKNKLAVLVFESTEPKAVNKDEIQEIMNNGQEERICALLSYLSQNYSPDPQEAAKERGF